MSLHDLVREAGGRLTEADRRLVDALMAHPKQTAFLSANEVARRASVHPASAVRFARKLGFDGYRELRASLQKELFGVSEAAERMRRRISHVGRGSVLKAFVDSEITTLGRLAEQVSDEAIGAAARAVGRASQTFLFGVGHATALTALLEARLGRLGYRTQLLRHAPRDLATNLAQARAGDAFVLFAFNAVNPLVPRVIRHARAVRATSIVISDLVGLTMRPNPDVLLAAARGGEGEPRSLAVPMTICNAMVLNVSRLDQGKTLRHLEALDVLRKELEVAP
jgi:DNA-binding MurR/RpiR family transcriptional regulator